MVQPTIAYRLVDDFYGGVDPLHGGALRVFLVPTSRHMSGKNCTALLAGYH